MTAGFGKTYVSAIMMYFVFAFWAVLTLSILCLMEGLSAFLHTLRKFISVSVHTYLILYLIIISAVSSDKNLILIIYISLL